VKFLVDASLPPSLSQWLAGRGHDAVHVVEVGIERAADELVLARAMREQRVLVTADLDFPRLMALAGAGGGGLILFRGGNYSGAQTLQLLQRTLETLLPEEIENSVVVVEETRIRRRTLPLRPRD
jgi:predicted nuclease of predicted toxin-antitoxin system